MRASHPGMQQLNDQFIYQMQGYKKMPLRLDFNGVEKNLALPSPEPGSLESWEIETRVLHILAIKESNKEEDDQYFTISDFEKEFEEEEEKFAKLRKALTKSPAQRDRYDYLVSCFELNNNTHTYCLHNFSLAELCAAITGIRRNVLQEDVQKKIWINPSLMRFTPSPQRKEIQDPWPVEIDATAIPVSWQNIFAQLPLVKLSKSPQQKAKVTEVVDPELVKKWAEVAEQSRQRTSLLPPKDSINKKTQEKLKSFSAAFHQQPLKSTTTELPQIKDKDREKLKTPGRPTKLGSEKSKTPRIHTSRTSLLAKSHRQPNKPEPEDLSQLKPTVAPLLPKLGKK